MSTGQTVMYVALSAGAAGLWMAAGAIGRKAWDWATTRHEGRQR